MKVKQINLDDEEQPETVLVELTHDEAVFVALTLGKQNGTDGEAILAGGSTLGSRVYWGLCGGVFNRFYEDGIDGAAEAARGRAS
ncbi:hypothetical protein [Streptomyces griseorubiginosus]|uniref:hypothetical protein n=1 Tax=Streptomyces griseorubiginosus TaxID=67304 RepID=UPI003322F4F5